MSATGNITGMSWDGTNTPVSESTNTKLRLYSGQFTSTLKDSEDISTIDNVAPIDLCGDDFYRRIALRRPFVIS